MKPQRPFPGFQAMEMLVYPDYQDSDLRLMLLEILSVFGRKNENWINNVVAISHYEGKIDAGDMGISQGHVYSIKWEAIMGDLIEENLVGVEQKGYREYFLKQDIDPNKYKDYLDDLKRHSYGKLRRKALFLHYNGHE